MKGIEGLGTLVPSKIQGRAPGGFLGVNCEEQDAELYEIYKFKFQVEIAIFECQC